MTVLLSEALAGCFAEQSGIPDGMFELLTELTVDDCCPAVSEWLLRDKNLPLELAERLAARRGATVAEAAAFAAREDMPSETLLDWVRKERRVTVLAQIAAKQDLPVAVFDALATRKGAALKKALLGNETAPATLRAVIAAELLTADRMSYSDRCELCTTLNSLELLQTAVFDRLSPDILLKQVNVVAEWEGLDVSRLHSLLDAVEQHAAAIPLIPAAGNGQKIDLTRRQTWAVAKCLAAHPSTDAGLLDRLEKFAEQYPPVWAQLLEEAVAVTRHRLEQLGEYRGPLHAAPYSTLVELADSGALSAVPVAQRARRNPLFDTAIAVKIIEHAIRSNSRDYAIERLLRDGAPDLASALRIQRAMRRWTRQALDAHISEASTDELVAALDAVVDDPEWGLRLAQEIAAAGIDFDEVVGRFGWFSDYVAHAKPQCRLGEATVNYLYRRFGAHYPTWRVFGSVAGPSTQLVDAAALAVHAEPPPADAFPATAGA